MLGISNPLMAIGASQFALSLMQVIFMFYYVKVYLNVFHVSQWWFNVAQALFMIWNAVNDPLFGYLQDTHSGWLKSRTAVIKYFSPFLCGSFVFLWYPWNLTGSWLEGVHLIIALFFYDAFFSAMGVAWSALFADSTRDDRSRGAAMKYSQVAILCSVNGIAVMEKASHSLDNFSAFFVVAVIVAFVSLLCLLSAGSLRDDKLIFSRDEFSDSLLDSENSHPESSWVHALRLTKETIHQKNFLFIVATNFIHIMRSVSHLNFASITTEILIPQEFLPKGSLRLSIFYGVCTLGPQVIIICLERVVVRVGAARLMLASHLASVVSALSMALFSHVPLAVITFMIVDSINVHSAAPLFNIVISEYIDNDSRRRARRSPISSFIFSLNALFTKPAQSVAPVVVVYILNLYGYQEYLTTKIAAESLQLAVRYILYGTPLFLGLAQYIVFRNYGLFSKKNSKELIM